MKHKKQKNLFVFSLVFGIALLGLFALPAHGVVVNDPEDSSILSIEPSLYDFGAVPVGETKDHSFTFRHHSESGIPFIGGSLTVSPPFSCVEGCTYSNLYMGNEMEIIIRFSPVSAGVAKGTITAGDRTLPGELSGEGIAKGTTITPGRGEQFKFKDPLNVGTLEKFLERIMGFMFLMAIALAPLLYVAAGFILVVAGGNPEKVQLAKNIFLWTTIGFVVILIASGLEMVIRDILGVRQ